MRYLAHQMTLKLVSTGISVGNDISNLTCKQKRTCKIRFL